MDNRIYSGNRVFYYDALRAFAIFGVLCCHVFAEYAKNTNIFATKFWYYALFLNSLSNVCVPLFVVLSGCLLIGRRETLIDFAKKRLPRIILPYLFWGIVFTLIFALVLHRGAVIDVALNAFSFAPEKDAKWLWFVPMILITYTVIFIINKLNEYSSKTLKVCLILSLIAVILINIGFLPMEKHFLYFYYSVFAVFGYYLSNTDLKNILKLSDKKLMIIFLILSIVLYIVEIVIIASMAFEAHKIINTSKFNFLNIILTSCIFLFLRYFEENNGKFLNHIKKNQTGKIIYSISICSYGIYLSHIVIKWQLVKYPLLTIKNILPISVYSTITLILTLIASWLIILILSKIPVLNKFSGAA